jgi:small subunit ribosomal protein S1
MKKGAIVTGKVVEVDAKGAKIELVEGVEGYLRVADISVERIEDASTQLSVGDSVEAKFVGVDRKNRTISLSIKAKDQADEREAIDSVNTKIEEDSGLSAMAEAFKNAKV